MNTKKSLKVRIFSLILLFGLFSLSFFSFAESVKAGTLTTSSSGPCDSLATAGQSIIKEDRSFYITNAWVGGTAHWTNSLVYYIGALNWTSPRAVEGWYGLGVPIGGCPMTGNGTGLLGQIFFSGSGDLDEYEFVINPRQKANGGSFGADAEYGYTVNECLGGQFTKNNTCVSVSGSINATPASCSIPPCSPTINWSTDALGGKVQKNGVDWQSGESGSVIDSGLDTGSYTYDLLAMDGFGNYYPVPVSSVTVNVGTALLKPSCFASFNPAPVGGTITFVADLGDGVNYTWSAPGATTPSGTGTSFSTSYNSANSYTVTVTSAGQSGNCAVTVIDSSQSINGQCGLANGSNFYPDPPSGATLCSVGGASSVVLSSPIGPWTWTCYGINSGSSASCAATYYSSGGSGSKCGTAGGKHYPSSATGYGSDTQCINGYHPTSTAFPAVGYGVTWWCNDVDETSYSPSCSAWRDTPGGGGSTPLTTTWVSTTTSPQPLDWKKSLDGYVPLNGLNTELYFTYNPGGCGFGYPSLECLVTLTISCGNGQSVVLNKTQIGSNPYIRLGFCNYSNPGIYLVTSVADFGSGRIGADSNTILVKTFPFVLNPPTTFCSASNSRMTWTWEAFPGATSYKFYGASIDTLGNVTTYTTYGIDHAQVEAYVGGVLKGTSNVLRTTIPYCVGDVTVKATYNSVPWSGDIKFSLIGPTVAESGASNVYVPTNEAVTSDCTGLAIIDPETGEWTGLWYFTSTGEYIYDYDPSLTTHSEPACRNVPSPKYLDLQNGTWTVSYISGGPGGSLTSIDSSDNKSENLASEYDLLSILKKLFDFTAKALANITPSPTQTLPGNVLVKPSRTFTMNFTNLPRYSLTVTKSSGGSVTSSDGIINCGNTCSANYAQGSSVTLQAVPDSSSWRFSGWSGGGCSGSGQCSTIINSTTIINATFSARQFNYREF